MTALGKWTPGVWRVGNPHGGNCNMIYEVDATKQPHGEESVAMVYGIPLHTNIDDLSPRWADGVARARLISAAPEMAEALMKMVDAFEHAHAYDDFLGHETEALEIARAALTKAGVTNG